VKTSNPAIGENIESKFSLVASNALTVQGVVMKTLFLTICLLVTAVPCWIKALKGNPGDLNGLLLIGCLGGLFIAFVIIFSPTMAPILSPIYALLEGLVLGALSGIMEAKYPGISIQAIVITLCCLFGMLFCYQTGIIKYSESFAKFILVALAGILLIYVVDIMLVLFNVPGIIFIHDTGPLGICFSIGIVTIASLSLIIDFENIVQLRGAPKYMEWYGAFSLMVSLVWLYIEVLRLLSKIRQK